MLLKNKPVLVTGGTGYVASRIIAELIDEGGYIIRFTVRNKSNIDKYKFLLDYAAERNTSLEVYEADLLKAGSFDAAVSGCTTVLHTASPFHYQDIKDAKKELIEPALLGTQNVLNSVNKSDTVTRVVLTSSVAAIFSDNIDIRNCSDGKFTEENWNTSSSEAHQPYSYSKTIAEKEAWAMAAKQNQWDLVVLNPGFIFGPSLSTRMDSTSVQTITDLISGKYRFGIPALSMGFVDVRDVAFAHLLAAREKKAKGRYILVSTTKNFIEIANIIRINFEEKAKLLPKKQLSKVIIWLLGPLYGLSRAYVSRNIGIEINFNILKGRNQLGVQYRSLSSTIKDHVQQLIDINKV